MRRICVAIGIFAVGVSGLATPGCTTQCSGIGDGSDGSLCEGDSDCDSMSCSGCSCVSSGTGGDGGSGGMGGGGATGGSGGSSGGGGSNSEQCAQGEFQMMPTGLAPYEIRREVCFHSMGLMSDCPIYNYRIPPPTDFSEFIDIWYGGTTPGCEDNMLGEFVESGDRYLLFGVPTREPPSSPDASRESVATGNYTIEGDTERGGYEFYWPGR